MKKNCVICGAEFTVGRSNRKKDDISIRSSRSITCSKECSEENTLRVAKRRREDNKDRVLSAEQIEKRRATRKRWKDKTRHLRNKYDDINKQDRQCVICEKQYIGHIQSTTCSKECRRVHKNNRRKTLAPPKVELFKECEQCGESFKVFHGKHKFCSNACSCRHRNPLKPKYHEKKCECCGKQYEGHRISKFCSITCNNKTRYENWKKKNPVEEKKCLHCDEAFTPSKRSETKYCSRYCQQRAWNLKNPKPKIPKRIVECVTCGTVFESNQFRAKYCSFECKRVVHRAKQRERQKPYSSLSPFQKINQRMSSLLRANLRYRGIQKNNTTYTLIGYTKIELREHLESLFTDGMSWDNMGEWHIDHIRPVASFNYDSTDHPEFKECWALENLQPLWAKDNMSKGSLWEGKRHRYKVIR